MSHDDLAVDRRHPQWRSIRVVSIFDERLTISEWDEDDSVRVALADLVLEAAEREEPVQRNNVGGWSSNENLFERPGPFQTLKARFLSVLQAPETGAYTAREWSLCAWANILRDGASYRAHDHGTHTWTGVYFAAATGGQGGLLRFHPTKGRHNVDTFPTSIAIQPVEGMLLVFPGHLPHSVDVWHGKIPRISIACNAWIQSEL